MYGDEDQQVNVGNASTRKEMAVLGHSVSSSHRLLSQHFAVGLKSRIV